MTGFSRLFREWQRAEIAAVDAERGLSRQLDAYCEGWGAAPPLHEIAAAQGLRSHANDLLRSVRAQLASERVGAPVL